MINGKDVKMDLHYFDIKTCEIIEFVDEEIENLQKKVAEKYGYDLVDHRLELYGIKKKSSELWSFNGMGAF